MITEPDRELRRLDRQRTPSLLAPPGRMPALPQSLSPSRCTSACSPPRFVLPRLFDRGRPAKADHRRTWSRWPAARSGGFFPPRIAAAERGVAPVPVLRPPAAPSTAPPSGAFAFRAECSGRWPAPRERRTPRREAAGSGAGRIGVRFRGGTPPRGGRRCVLHGGAHAIPRALRGAFGHLRAERLFSRLRSRLDRPDGRILRYEFREVRHGFFDQALELASRRRGCRRPRRTGPLAARQRRVLNSDRERP